MAQNWFKHDYNARNDDKILELRAEMGWEGYGLFFALIEMMCDNEQGYIDGQKIGGLSLGLNVPKDTLKEFIEHCLDIGLFYIGDDEMIHNNRVDIHVDKMNSYIEAGKKGAKKRWNKQSDRGAKGGLKGSDATPNADKSRVDKRREEKNRVATPPEFDEVLDYFLNKGFSKQLATKFYNYYQEPMEDRNGRVWKDQDGKTVKSWKQKAISVWFKNKKNGSYEKGSTEHGQSVSERVDRIFDN